MMTEMEQENCVYTEMEVLACKVRIILAYFGLLIHENGQKCSDLSHCDLWEMCFLLQVFKWNI